MWIHKKIVDFHEEKCGSTKIFVDLQGKSVDPQFKVWIFLGIPNFFQDPSEELWIHKTKCGSTKISEDFFFINLQIFVDQ